MKNLKTLFAVLVYRRAIRRNEKLTVFDKYVLSLTKRFYWAAGALLSFFSFFCFWIAVIWIRDSNPASVSIIAIFVLAFLFFVALVARYILFGFIDYTGKSAPSDTQLIEKINKKIDSFGNQFGSVRDIIFISGEAPPAVYTQAALNRMYANPDPFRQRPVKVIAGPVILYDESNPNLLPAIFTMVAEGYVELSISPKRQIRHFMVSDDGYMRLEKRHESCQPYREALIIRHDINGLSKEAIDEFNHKVAEEKSVDRSLIGIDKDIILMLKEDVRKLTEEIRRETHKEFGFDSLDIHEIKEKANQYQIPYKTMSDFWDDVKKRFKLTPASVT